MRLGLMLLAAPIVWGQEAQLPDIAKMSADDLQRGERLYAGHCAGCHGPRGDGGKGANLARPKQPRAHDDAALYRIIGDGTSGTEMPGSWAMIEREKWQVAAFVRSLGRVSQEMVTGDAVKGEQLFQTKGCVACHALDGKGGRMG